MTDTDGPYSLLPIEGGEVRLLLGAEDDPATVDNCDGFVDGVDGSTKSFTIMTLAAIDRVMSRWESSGEGGSGSHLRVPDLIVLRSGGIDKIAAAVEDLVDELPPIVLEHDEGTACCRTMQSQLTWACPDHPDLVDCPDSLFARQQDGTVGLRIHDGGSSMTMINACPWCGTPVSTLGDLGRSE